MNTEKQFDGKFCTQEQCAHFIEVGKQYFYRKKFIWIVVVFSIVCICVLGGLLYYYNSQSNTIVLQHKSVMSAQTEMIQTIRINKGIAQIDENILRNVEAEMNTIENILKLQTANLHSQFTLLSIWAGVLMIVFLVFSLYSMFKTDELIRQARDSINTIENSKADVDAKIKDAIEHIDKESSRYIENFKKNLQIEQNRVSEEYKSKFDETSKILSEYQKKMENYNSAVEGIHNGIKVVLDAINKTGTSSTYGVTDSCE